MAQLAAGLANVPPYSERIDLDAVIAGALLHDLAKVDEYGYEGVPIDLAPLARLRHHTSKGPELVAR